METVKTPANQALWNGGMEVFGDMDVTVSCHSNSHADGGLCGIITDR